MRTIIYEYSPLQTGESLPTLEDILETSSPYWQVINAVPKNSPAAVAAAAAAADMGEKLVYTPCSYVAADYFAIKPEEWFRIKFVGPSPRVPRPDVIYEPVVAWPLPELKIHQYQLTLLVQNGCSLAHISVHKKSRLHHLLQMSKIDSIFTLVPTDDDDDDDDNDKEEEKKTSSSPPEEAAAAAAAPPCP